MIGTKGREMGYPQLFLDAFNFSMRYEVGPNFNPNDPDTIAGKCSTQAQCLKTGYTADKVDPGGETKFGVAKNANPDVNIKTMTLDQAQSIYFNKYWYQMKCDSFSGFLPFILFDASVNHGVPRASKMLQTAIGLTGGDVDGDIGNYTISIAKSFNPAVICDKILQSRIDLFNAIVKNNPSQRKFLNGWLNRIANIKTIMQKGK